MNIICRSHTSESTATGGWRPSGEIPAGSGCDKIGVLLRDTFLGQTVYCCWAPRQLDDSGVAVFGFELGEVPPVCTLLAAGHHP
mmetsp:Transcript_66875/g.74906  ORF Transcript_66875/g.74906 Transcript_66875/m.74906 type:complete len:84 (-) Transcript_66875:57-308(-)